MTSEATTLATYLDDIAPSLEHGQRLGSVILEIAAASRTLSTRIREGALSGLVGRSGSANIQGEEQEKLDVAADLLMHEHLLGSEWIAGVASEERAEPSLAESPDGAFLVAFDPLDGSSNIDVNITVGSIFSILPAPAHSPEERDFLRPGSEQLAAGYCLYGPSTTLVITVGRGVEMFTLDASSGAFIRTRSGVSIPREASEFAINASNRRRWDPPVQRWFDECLAGREGPRARDFNMRWIASLVAEVHRILTRGGVFSYPLDARLRAQGKTGRLRLLYELAPMALLIEQAGGAASTGHQRLLEVVPGELHARAPVFLGAADEVALLEAYHADWASSVEP